MRAYCVCFSELLSNYCSWNYFYYFIFTFIGKMIPYFYKHIWGLNVHLQSLKIQVFHYHLCAPVKTVVIRDYMPFFVSNSLRLNMLTWPGQHFKEKLSISFWDIYARTSKVSLLNSWIVFNEILLRVDPLNLLGLS